MLINGISTRSNFLRNTIKSIAVVSVTFAPLLFPAAAEQRWSFQGGDNRVNLVTERLVSQSDYSRYTQSFNLSTGFSEQTSVDLGYSRAEQQSAYRLGIRHNSVTVSLLRGGAENYITSYSFNQNPYLFHGGSDRTLAFSDTAVSLDLGKSQQVTLGTARVDSRFGDTRKSNYLTYRNKTVVVQASRLAVASQSIGYSMKLSKQTQSGTFHYSRVSLNGGRSIDSMQYSFRDRARRKWTVKASRHQNSFYREQDDYQVWLAMEMQLGRKRTSSRASDLQSAFNNSQSDYFANVSTASAASSGVVANDTRHRFSLQQVAAWEALQAVDGVSVSQNKEYGGWIYLNRDGSYASTGAVSGTHDSLSLPVFSSYRIAGAKAAGIYHTHGAYDPRYDSENFSKTDISTFESVGVDGYLGTPAGKAREYNVTMNTVTDLAPLQR